MTDRLPHVTLIGGYDERGNPYIDFFLRGTAPASPGLPCRGIVDTGFSGFVQVPWDAAFKMRLPMFGLATVRLADNSRPTTLLALGQARLKEDSDPQVGEVHISQAPDILVGMEFLRAFQQGLGVFQKTVVLMDDPT